MNPCKHRGKKKSLHIKLYIWKYQLFLTATLLFKRHMNAASTNGLDLTSPICQTGDNYLFLGKWGVFFLFVFVMIQFPNLIKNNFLAHVYYLRFDGKEHLNEIRFSFVNCNFIVLFIFLHLFVLLPSVNIFFGVMEGVELRWRRNIIE